MLTVSGLARYFSSAVRICPAWPFVEKEPHWPYRARTARRRHYSASTHSGSLWYTQFPPSPNCSSTACQFAGVMFPPQPPQPGRLAELAVPPPISGFWRRAQALGSGREPGQRPAVGGAAGALQAFCRCVDLRATVCAAPGLAGGQVAGGQVVIYHRGGPERHHAQQRHLKAAVGVTARAISRLPLSAIW